MKKETSMFNGQLSGQLGRTVKGKHKHRLDGSNSKMTKLKCLKILRL
jgi:hypothetical protein